MLIQRAVDFDITAQKQLFDLYYKRMWKHCMKYTKNSTDASDLLYTSYQSFFRTLNRFKYSDEDSVMKWLKGIVYLNFQNQRRKKFSWEPLPSDEETAEIVMPGVEEKMDHARLMSLVMRHKDNKYVMVFILHVIWDWEHEEISGRLRIPKNTSYKYLFRGRQHLQDQLGNFKNSFI